MPGFTHSPYGAARTVAPPMQGSTDPAEIRLTNALASASVMPTPQQQQHHHLPRSPVTDADAPYPYSNPPPQTKGVYAQQRPQFTPPPSANQHLSNSGSGYAQQQQQYHQQHSNAQVQHQLSSSGSHGKLGAAMYGQQVTVPPSYGSHGVPSPAPQTNGPTPSYAPQGFAQQLQFNPAHHSNSSKSPISAALPFMAPMQFQESSGNAPLSLSGPGGSRRRSRRGDSGNRLDLSNSGGRHASGDFGHNSGRLHLSGDIRHLVTNAAAPPPPPPPMQNHPQRQTPHPAEPMHAAPELSAFGRSASYATSNDVGTDRDERASMVSGSSTSSVRDDLPLCENDANCHLINDRRHQRQVTHTCRLFPCYHAQVKRHAKLFRHAPGQLIETPAVPASATSPLGASGKGGKQSQRASLALASVNFMHISPEAPNAVRITVSSATKSFEIFGDWTQVKLHTFKRYLHQVFGVPPVAQRLFLQAKELDDDLSSVAGCGVGEGSKITLQTDDDRDLSPHNDAVPAHAAKPKTNPDDL